MLQLDWFPVLELDDGDWTGTFFAAYSAYEGNESIEISAGMFAKMKKRSCACLDYNLK